jgi:hypothetical protein
MATIRRWTKDEIATLRSLAQKQRVADIAAGLGRSSSSIAVKAHQLVPRHSDYDSLDVTG